MKKILLSLMVLALIGVSHQLQAQCSITNFGITVQKIESVPSGGCMLTVEIKFTGNFNNGNKFAVVHIWESSPVNNYPGLTYATAPTAAELSNSLANIVITDPGKSTAALHNQYIPNGAVPVKFTGVTFSKTGSNFTLTNVKIFTSSCAANISLKGDAWSNQSSNDQNVHCFNTNSINFTFANPIVFGLIQCGNPRLFNVTVNNTANSAATQVTYNAFVDGGTLGVRDAGDIQVFGPSVVNAGANATVTTAFNNYPNAYSATKPFSERDLFIDAVATTPLGNITYSGVQIDNSCAALPVTFKSVNANRKNASSVGITWTTSSEQNNRGFNVQRNDGAGWKNVAYVFSQSVAGTSSSDLSYEYNDANTEKGVSQYRIQQVDLDGRASFSIIRAIRGESVATKMLVYPNPSSTGNINVVFDNNSGVRDVMVSDAAGRLVKSFRSITNNILVIENLKRGFYSLKVTNRTTASSSVEKVVIK